MMPANTCTLLEDLVILRPKMSEPNRFSGCLQTIQRAIELAPDTRTDREQLTTQPLEYRLLVIASVRDFEI
jgi:hypothetical protein